MTTRAAPWSLVEREQVDVSAKSICDALQVATPGKITFSINKDLLGGRCTGQRRPRFATRFVSRLLI